MADIEQAAGHRLGFLNPSLYALASSDPSAFHDVVSGCSSVESGSTVSTGYCAHAGWDFTGLGSPDAVALLHYFAPDAKLGTGGSGSSTTTLLEAGSAAAVVLAVAAAVALRRRKPEPRQGFGPDGDTGAPKPPPSAYTSGPAATR